jgi:sec-independent protein translocase protein TatA
VARVAKIAALGADPSRLTGEGLNGTMRRERAISARVEASMFGMGPMELGIILVIVVVLFGARRLPEIGAGFGKAIKNFKAGVTGEDEIDVTPNKDKDKVDPGDQTDSSSST